MSFGETGRVSGPGVYYDSEMLDADHQPDSWFPKAVGMNIHVSDMSISVAHWYCMLLIVVGTGCWIAWCRRRARNYEASLAGMLARQAVDDGGRKGGGEGD